MKHLPLLLLPLLFLTACGKNSAPPPGEIATAPGHQAPPVEQPPVENPPIADPGIGYFHKAALWSQPVSSSLGWTRAVLDIVQHRLADFEKANDTETFCPGYSKANAAQRRICWLRLVGGVVEFESSFRPDEPPFNEGNGIFSVGLMALSTGECPNAPTQKLLMDPVQNLICGVNKMAALIVRFGAIDSPDLKGACAYWSTLQPPHQKWDPVRQRWLNLGKKDQIIVRTKKFREF